MQRDAVGVLEHRLLAITNIEQDTKGLSEREFREHRHPKEAILWNFSVLGEAANRLRRRHPELATRISFVDQIVGFRNLILHGYDQIDDSVVWTIV